MTDKKSVFATLSAIDCSEHVEKKNGLSYVSWAWAWKMVKDEYPDAVYTVYERPDGCIYWTDGSTCWVKTGVTIGGLEHIEYLPVMDFKNRSIPLGNVTSFDVNKAIQRSLTKACARHGLGLYIYAGEDIPEQTDAAVEAKPAKKPDKWQPVRGLIEKAKRCGLTGEALNAWCAETFPGISKSDFGDTELRTLEMYLKSFIADAGRKDD